MYIKCNYTHLVYQQGIIINLGCYALVDEVLKCEYTFTEKPVYSFFKRTIDIILSFFLIILLSPLLIIVALIVKLHDGGNIIYKSPRIGQGDKTINVYKFRTMKMGADRLEDTLSEEELKKFKLDFKLEKDNRITKVGKVLRKTSIDELPQLFNVLIGNMSLVGPRPVSEEETYLYGENRDLLLKVKPGITGLWQACGRNKISYVDYKRQHIELKYVTERSFWLDIKIMFMTVSAVLKMDGAN